jgi:hypothetical protein
MILEVRARFLRRADAMGLLDEPIQELSAEVVRRVAKRLSKRGLASDVAARLATAAPSRDEFVRYLDAALLALDESPVPAAELAKLNSILGHEVLVGMLDISAASLQRYENGDREAPDSIAERAHFLTSVIAALEGTYNDFGVRIRRSRQNAGEDKEGAKRGNLLDYLSVTGLDERIARSCCGILGINVPRARLMLEAYELLLHFAERHQLISAGNASATLAELIRLRGVLDT